MNNLSIGRQYIFEKSKQESIVLNIGEVRKSSIHDLICEARLVEVEEWICEGEI
jgi:hypothetical protein